MDMLHAAKEEATALIYEAISRVYGSIKIGRSEIISTMVVPESGHGDLSTSICFKIARIVNEAPHELATKLIAALVPKENGIIEKFEEDHGYINMFFNVATYSKGVISSIFSINKEQSISRIGKGKKVIVEFPSVNPVKPWHVGHLRNALLGDVISNMLSACSYKVEREDYIDDLGLQVAESLWGFLNISSNVDKKFDKWLGEQYVEVNKRLENVSAKDEVEKLLKRIEDGSTEEARMAKEISEKCVRAQYETAFSYGIYHDVLIWESDIVRARLLEQAVKILEANGIISNPAEGKYAGCKIIDIEKVKSFSKDFEGAEEEAKVLIRSNGTATYLAKDIAFHMWKFGLLSGFTYSTFMDMQPNGRPLFTTSATGKQMDFGGVQLAVNIIGSAQRYSQLLLRATFDLLGHKEISSNLLHISYGEVSIEGMTISGRRGIWLGKERSYTADDLLAEAEKKALAIVKSNAKLSKVTSEEHAKSIAHSIAVAAIRFEYLRIAPEKKISFSWDKALNFEGNSGPYCMYSFARAASILERGNFDKSKTGDSDYAMIERGHEFELIKMLGRMQEVIEKACNEYRPNIITDYAIGLSTTFSRFYESLPVLKGGEHTQARLSITFCFKQALGYILYILGIDALEKI